MPLSTAALENQTRCFPAPDASHDCSFLLFGPGTLSLHRLLEANRRALWPSSRWWIRRCRVPGCRPPLATRKRLGLVGGARDPPETQWRLFLMRRRGWGHGRLRAPPLATRPFARRPASTTVACSSVHSGRVLLDNSISAGHTLLLPA